MINEKLKGFLGICRRSGKLSAGRDASVASIKKRKAFLTVMCSDCSQRLKDEISDECEFHGRSILCITAPFTMNELYTAVGIRAGVFTVDDENLAKKLYDLTGGNS